MSKPSKLDAAMADIQAERLKVLAELSGLDLALGALQKQKDGIGFIASAKPKATRKPKMAASAATETV